MIISSKMDAQGTERSDEDDTLSEEGKEEKEEEEEEEVGVSPNDEERRLLDELEGLEEAEEEEYSGPLLAEEEEEEDDINDDEGQDEEEEVDDAVEEQAQIAPADPEADDGVFPEDEEEGEKEEEEEEEEEDGRPAVLDFLSQPPELDPGTPQEQAEFYDELRRFFAERKMDFRTPRFYGENLNLLKLWRTVIRLGAYDYVTAHKLWRRIGLTFKPPKKCTTVSWSFRIYYEKSLLEYERHMLQGTGYTPRYGAGACSDTAGEVPSSDIQNGIPQPRAKRDAAIKAMQGWHAQRILENEDVDPLETKDKSSLSAGKREKQFDVGAFKRKGPALPDRATKNARLVNKGRGHMLVADAAIKHGNGSYMQQSYNGSQRNSNSKQGHLKQFSKSSNQNIINGADIRVVDEGLEADWVKINVHKTGDCFEVYALVPGLLQEELRIQCESGGILVIIGEPEQPNNPWGVTPFKKVIKLPSPIDVNQTSAVITLHGQLFVRVPYAEGHTWISYT